MPKLPSVVSSFKMFTYIAYYQFHLFLEKPDILWYSLEVFYTWYITIMWNLLHHCLVFRSVQFSSVVQSCLTLCDPMDCSMPGLPVHHKLLEFTQTHVHQVSDAIQSSHPLSSPSPPTFNLSQHQGLFKWVSFFASDGQSIGVSASTSVLPMNT